MRRQKHLGVPTRGFGEQFECTSRFPAKTTFSRGCRHRGSSIDHLTLRPKRDPDPPRGHRVEPHVGDMTESPLGVPWAEKWPSVRYCGSVAERTLMGQDPGPFGTCHIAEQGPEPREARLIGPPHEPN